MIVKQRPGLCFFYSGKNSIRFAATNWFIDTQRLIY